MDGFWYRHSERTLEFLGSKAYAIIAEDNCSIPETLPN